MIDAKIQWYPGFVAAMHMEHTENGDDLTFEREHNLNTKPLEIDLLVVKKNPSVHIKKLRGDDNMSQVLLEIMEPEIRKIRKKERIEGAVETLRDCKYGDDEIISIIMGKYQLSQEEAINYLQC